jgi:folate-binding protein YgfZ
VIAIVRFRQLDDAVYALLPTDLVPRVAEQLRKFVLRSKVAILQATDLHVGALFTGHAASLTEREAFDGAALTMSPVPMAGATEVVSFHYAPGREVVAAPPSAWRSISGLSLSRPDPQGQSDWIAADVAAGLPQVFAATTGQFTPQMLNLDLLEGISFAKGCYTGQEIIARTQHLGRVKRRTLRYRLPAGPAPAPLQGLYLDGAKVADVLMSATAAAAVELLAVPNLDAGERPLLLEDGRVAEPWPLPYAVVTQP